jgi:hypothetical protein
VTPTKFIYTGGAEDGVCVRLINYPRFPKTPEEIVQTASELAEFLRSVLCQWSYSIETPTTTFWQTHRVERENG